MGSGYTGSPPGGFLKQSLAAGLAPFVGLQPAGAEQVVGEPLPVVPRRRVPQPRHHEDAEAVRPVEERVVAERAGVILLRADDFVLAGAIHVHLAVVGGDLDVCVPARLEDRKELPAEAKLLLEEPRAENLDAGRRVARPNFLVGREANVEL